MGVDIGDKGGVGEKKMGEEGERTEGGLGMFRVEADRLNNVWPLAGVSGYPQLSTFPSPSSLARFRVAAVSRIGLDFGFSVSTHNNGN